MTIHHDKLAYGKLASGMEEMTEEQIAEMLTLLNCQADEDNAESAEVETVQKNNKKY